MITNMKRIIPNGTTLRIILIFSIVLLFALITVLYTMNSDTVKVPNTLNNETVNPSNSSNDTAKVPNTLNNETVNPSNDNIVKVHDCYITNVPQAKIQGVNTIFFDDFSHSLDTSWRYNSTQDDTPKMYSDALHCKNPPHDNALVDNQVLVVKCVAETCVITMKQPLDLSKYKSATLSFWTHTPSVWDPLDASREAYDTDPKQFMGKNKVWNPKYVKVEAYNGISWSLLTSYNVHPPEIDHINWIQESFDLSRYLDVSNFRIRLVVENMDQDHITFVDDIKIKGVHQDFVPMVYPEPTIQIQQGITLQDVQCNSDETLAFTNDGALPVCLPTGHITDLEKSGYLSVDYDPESDVMLDIDSLNRVGYWYDTRLATATHMYLNTKDGNPQYYDLDYWTATIIPIPNNDIGSLYLKIPKTYFDDTLESEFFLLVDGINVPYVLVETSETHNILKINFEPGSRYVYVPYLGNSYLIFAVV